MLKRFVLAVVAVLGVLPAMGQVATGLYPYGSFDNEGFDQIDRGSLNVHFTIPIVNKQGRGLPFQYALAYDGLVWTPGVANGVSAWVPDPGFGLHGLLVNDGYKGYLAYNVAYRKCFSGGTLLGNYPVYSNYVYHDPNGAKHVFTLGQNTCAGTDSGSGLATDGSGYSTDGANVRDVRGNEISPPTYVNGAPGATSGSATDANGNQITNDQNSVFTDTTGVNILTASGTGTAAVPKKLTYLTYGGSATVTITYKTYTVGTKFGCAPVDYNQSVDLPDRVTLADHSYYQFTYEATPGSSTTVTGRLASIVLPTGGQISYSYSAGVNCTDGTPLNLTRTTADGQATYYRSAITSTSSHTEIKDGAGNFSEYDFVTAGSPAAFHETLAAVYAGSASGTPLVSRQTCYNNTTPACTTTPLVLPITQIDTYETLNGGLEHGSTLKFNSFGLTTEQDDYDFASGARGNVMRRELWAYPTSGVADLVQSDIVYDGSSPAPGVAIRLTAYGYDGQAPSPTSGLPQHVGPPDSQRGNLTSVMQWLNTTSTYITTQANTYDDAGQVLTSTVADGGRTQYGYDSTHTFVTSTTLPTPSSGVAMATSAQYDVASGVLLSTTDVNGQSTTYSNYDALNRAQTITYPDGGHLQFSYSPTQLIQNNDVGGSEYTQYDGYGRVNRVADFNGQNSGQQWYLVDSCYNANGQLAFQPTRYQDNGFASAKRCSGPGDTTTYDALGRVLSVTHADGSTSTRAYAGRATKQVDEIGVTRIQQQDGLGRITAVCEVSSNSMQGQSPSACNLDIAATGYLTTYTYSLANYNVITNTGGMARVFATDSFGRLTSVQEPEMFVAGNANTVTQFNYAYNGTGLVVTRTRPRANQTNPNVVTHTQTQYDLLSRPVEVTYDDNGVTPWKLFIYDQNFAEPAWPQSNQKGRLSHARTTVPNNLGAFDSAIQWSYDANGRVISMLECASAATCANVSLTKELDFLYDLAGREIRQTDPIDGVVNYAYTPANEVSSITNSTYNNAGNPPTYVSSVANTPAGPTLYHLGNGLNGVFTYDAANRTQFKWLCANSTASFCSGGTQLYGMNASWAGAYLTGSIDTLINTGGNYTYDEFGRLKSFASTIGQASSFQWTYDRFGNRWSQTPGASVTFDNMNHKLDGSTAYDAAGNVMKDASHSYAYDAENNLLTVDGGSTASYNYDVLNERTQVKLPANSRPNLEFTYDYAGRRVGVWDANANVGIQGQIWWGSQPFAYRDTDGNTYFEFLDWEGTQRVLTNSAGAVSDTYKSNPFGDGYTPTGPSDNWLHYADLEHESWSGTEHAQFRQLNASVGTWMSMDPYLGSYDFTNPQSLNRYTYALNNPTSLTDPSGLDPCFTSQAVILDEAGNVIGGTSALGSGCPVTIDISFCWWCQAYGIPSWVSAIFAPSQSNQTPPPPHARRGIAPSKTGCFAKGVLNGAAGGLLVAGGTVIASTVLAPEVVTAGLLAAGAYGGYQLYQSISSNLSSGNQAGLAYSLGSLVGGAAVGGATSYGVRYSITGETGGPSSLLDFSGLTKLTNPFRSGNSILGNLRSAFSKGPDLLGGGAAIAGGAGYRKGGC